MIYTITIILPSTNLSDEVNKILHKYSDSIIGRMGLPQNNENEFILTIVLKTDKKNTEKILEEINSVENIKSDYLVIE